jgi:L-fuconolactonase
VIVDSHQHFWRYDAGEYDWIGDDLAAIRRDFLPEDLSREVEHAGVDAVVTVQARQTLDETRWLLELAEANDFIAGVVGWVPLVSPAVGDTMAELAVNPRLRRAPRGRARPT